MRGRKINFVLSFDAVSSKVTGNPLWLTGVDAPITKKHISKCLKISKKNILIYI
jgi:hypothetical protein